MRVKASGNAYPVPLLISVLRPMMEMLKGHLKKNISKPKDLTCGEAATCSKKFLDWMKDFKLQASQAQGNSSKKKSKKSSKKASAKKKAASKKAKSSGSKETTKKVKKTMKKTTKKSKTSWRATYKYRFLSSSES